MKTLIIAEKPSVARDIAKVLKCDKKGDGYLFSETYMVTWALGHLVTLWEPEDYDAQWARWRFDTLPIAPLEIKLKPVKKTESQLRIVKKLMNDKEVDKLICATDSGREGELIFRYIYAFAKCKKPFKRLWISSMTDKAILDGFQKLKDGKEFDNLYYSAKCRSEADWLVGMNASRAYTLKYKALLSIGRVQTPTLAIIVERQKEIDAFQSKVYYEIDTLFEKYKGKWYDKKENDSKILEKEKAQAIVDKIKGKQGVIQNIEKEEKKQAPPLLYDLTELQRDCNKKFGFSAQKTLSLAQDLYEKRKMITYPRTDSRYLSEDMKAKIPTILNRIQAVPAYQPFGNYVLGLQPLPFSKRIIDDTKITDHHAMIPTEAKINMNVLSGDEQKVYDLIVRRFLAVFYPVYIYYITRITTEIEGELFMTKGTTITQLGWMELYQGQAKGEDKNNDEEESLLPEVAVGETYQETESTIAEKKTKPPKAYNEALLLSAMENAGRFVEDENLKEQLKQSGIGTPATRAAIIERLIDVGYITRKGKTLIATEKGIKLIEVVPPQLKSPETTGRWEKGLNAIAKGTMDTEKFMGSILRYVSFLVQDAKNSQVQVVFPEEQRKGKKTKAPIIGKCPACGGDVLENSKAFFCAKWKDGCKFTMWKNILDRYGNHFDATMAKKILKEKSIKEVPMTLPQTMEKCIGTLVFKDEKTGLIEFINLNRLPAEQDYSLGNKPS